MCKASRVVAILMSGFLLAACGFAQASAVTSYTDPTLYGAAAGSLTTIDFQSILGPGVVGANYNNQILSVGPVNFNGITTDLPQNSSFSALSITNYAGYNTFGASATAVVGGAVATTTDAQSSGLLSADLASYSTAVGFYVGMTNPGDAGSFTIDVKTADGQTHSFSATSPAGGVASFIGFTAADAITGVDISSTPSDLSGANPGSAQNPAGIEANIALGDFSYNSPAAPDIDSAPFPNAASAGLMLICAVGAFTLLRRRFAAH